MKVNKRKGAKYAAEREWAYDLIANSKDTVASEMADMMAEQFGHAKSTMGHTLLSLVKNGALKITGYTTRNGKRTYVLAANKRRAASTVLAPIIPLPDKKEAETPNNVVNPWVPAPTRAPTATLTISVDTGAGAITLTMEQAKALAGALGGLFK
jgi:hypothetical protein